VKNVCNISWILVAAAAAVAVVAVAVAVATVAIAAAEVYMHPVQRLQSLKIVMDIAATIVMTMMIILSIKSGSFYKDLYDS